MAVTFKGFEARYAGTCGVCETRFAAGTLLRRLSRGYGHAEGAVCLAALAARAETAEAAAAAVAADAALYCDYCCEFGHGYVGGNCEEALLAAVECEVTTFEAVARRRTEGWEERCREAEAENVRRWRAEGGW